MSFRLDRRQILWGMAALGVLSGGDVRNAFGQKRIIVPEGDFAPLPIAIPNFVAGTPSGAGTKFESFAPEFCTSARMRSPASPPRPWKFSC